MVIVQNKKKMHGTDITIMPKNNSNSISITRRMTENLWAKLGKEIRNHWISNKDDVKKNLREEWERISPEWTKKLVESIPDRLKEVTVNWGLQTQTVLKELGGKSFYLYEGWNFNSGNYLFTTDTK